MGPVCLPSISSLVPRAHKTRHPTETGMSRPSLSDADKQARDWFADTTSSLGCKVTVDAMGNQFAVKPGRQPGHPTAAGSHLDTQPTGGRYDGILGVAAGVEMLRVLDDAKHQTEFPVAVVNWTNEEGARFPISMVASGVWAGAIAQEHAHDLASVVRSDPSGTTMLSELKRIGYLGSVPCSHEAIPLAAHFELHIEQGPLLEAAGQRLGVVEGVQAYRWFTVTVKGRDCHTGTTDLSNRADALLGASKMIARARQVAWEHGALASTGIIEARPGSTNTVPGTVIFSMDIRAQADGTVNETEAALRSEFEAIASGADVMQQTANPAPVDKLAVEWRLDSDSRATNFHSDCIECVQKAANTALQDEKLSRRMVSGAGHDSVYASRRAPTSMIFVPCRDGVSHNPAEYTSPEDCALGAQVLTLAVLEYDAMRATRGS